MNTQNGSNNPLLRTLARGNGGAGSPAENWKGQSTNSSSSPLLETLRQRSNAGENTARQRLQTGHTAPKNLGGLAFSGDYDTDTEELRNRQNNVTLWAKYLSALESDIAAGEKLYRSTKSEDDYKRYEAAVDQYNRAVGEVRPVYEQYGKDYKAYQDRHKGIIGLSNNDYSTYTAHDAQYFLNKADAAVAEAQKAYDEAASAQIATRERASRRSDTKDVAAAKAKLDEANAVAAYYRDLVNRANSEGFEESRRAWIEGGYEVPQIYQDAADKVAAGEAGGIDLSLVEAGYGALLSDYADSGVSRNRFLTATGAKFEDTKKEVNRDFWKAKAEEAGNTLKSLLPQGIAGEQKYEAKAEWEESSKRYRELQSKLREQGRKATSAAEWAPAVVDMAIAQVASAPAGVIKMINDGLGGPDTPLRQLADNVLAERDAAQQRFNEAFTGTSGGAQLAAQLGIGTLAAIPNAVMAMLTGGASLAATPATLTTAAASAPLTGAASLMNTTYNALKSTAANPMYWNSFATAAGHGYLDAVEDGAGYEKAVMYAVYNGALNAAIEVGGGIEKLPGELQQLNDALPVSELAKKIFIDSGVEEGMEEVYQGITERVLQNAILGADNQLASISDPDAIFSLYGAGLEFLGGFTAGTILGGFQSTNDLIEAVGLAKAAKQLNSQISTVSAENRPASLNTLSATAEDIDAAYHQLIIAKAKDAAEGKLVKTSGSNPSEATYNAAVTANPDKSVMHPIATELTEAGYTDAKKAVKQGEILEKVFSGEDITDAELDALDLNNEAVRTVFANRSGLTGMKDVADFTRELKRTYVAEAVKNVRDLKATQDAAGTASQQVLEKEKAKAQTLTKNLFKNRAAAAEAREQQIQQSQAEAKAREAREKPLALDGKTEADVVEEVSKRSGAVGLQTMSAFAETWMQENNVAALDPVQLAQMTQAYREYLGTINLSRAEVNALVSVGTAALHDETKAIREEFEAEGEAKIDEEVALVNAIRERGIDLPTVVEFLEETLNEDKSFGNGKDAIDEIKQMYAAYARSLGVTETEIQQILAAFDYEVVQLFNPGLTNEQDGGNSNITTENKEDTNGREEGSGNGRSAGERSGGAHDSGRAGAVSEGSGQHEVHDDGRRDVGGTGQAVSEVRESLISAQELFGSEELGTDEANLHVLTGAEIAANEEWAAVKKSIEESGGRAVLLTGETIHAIVGGKKFDIRGAVNHTTGEVFVVVDNKSATAAEIKDHELFHLFSRKDPAIFDSVMRSVAKARIKGKVDAALRVYKKKYPYGNDISKYLEEIFGDANAGINPYNLPEMAEITRVVKETMAGEEVQQRIRAIKGASQQSGSDMRFSAASYNMFAGYDDIDEDMIQGYNPYADMDGGTEVDEDEGFGEMLEETFTHRDKYGSGLGEYQPAKKPIRVSAQEREWYKETLSSALVRISNLRSKLLDTETAKELFREYSVLPENIKKLVEGVEVNEEKYLEVSDAYYERLALREISGSRPEVRRGNLQWWLDEYEGWRDDLRGVLQPLESVDAGGEARYLSSASGEKVRLSDLYHADNLRQVGFDYIKQDPWLLSQWVKNASYGAETFFVTTEEKGLLWDDEHGEVKSSAGVTFKDSGVIVVCVDLVNYAPAVVSSHERFHWLCALTENEYGESPLILNFFKKYKAHISDYGLFKAYKKYEYLRTDVESPYDIYEEMLSDVYGLSLYGMDSAFRNENEVLETQNIKGIREYIDKQFKGAAVRKRVKQLDLPDFSFSAAADESQTSNYLSLSDESLRAHAADYYTKPFSYFGMDFGPRAESFDQLTNRQKVIVYLSMFGAELETMVGWDMVPAPAVKEARNYSARMSKGEVTPEQAAHDIYNKTHPNEVADRAARDEKILKARAEVDREKNRTAAEARVFDEAVTELSKELTAQEKALRPKGAKSVKELRAEMDDTDIDAENIWKNRIKKSKSTKSFFSAPGGQQILSYLKALGVDILTEKDGEFTRSRAIELAVEMQGAVNRGTITARAAAEAIRDQLANADTDTRVKDVAAAAIKQAKAPAVTVSVPQKTSKVKFTPPAPKAAPNFVKDVFQTKPGAPIVVTFKSGKTANYTTNILNDLRSDPDVAKIVDAESGNTIYEAAPKATTTVEPAPEVKPAAEPVTEPASDATPAAEPAKAEEAKPAKKKPAPKKAASEKTRKKGTPRKKALPEKVETEKEQEQFTEAFDQANGEGAAEQILNVLKNAEAKTEALERALEAERARAAEMEQKLNGAEARKEARKTISLEKHRQDMKRLNRLLANNSRVDQTWARGLAESADRFARAEERRIAERKLREQRVRARAEKQKAVDKAREEAKETLEAQRGMTREVRRKLTAEAKTARQWARGLMRSREAALKSEADKSAAKAKQQTKHENTWDAKRAKQTLARRRHSGAADPTNNGSGTVLNAREVMAERKKINTAAEKLRTAGRTFYRNFVSAVAELESFGRLQTKTLRTDVLVNVMGAYMDTVQSISENNLLGRDGRILGNSMQDTFLCWKGEGKKREWDKDAQQTLKEYMVYLHTEELMSFEPRAWERLLAFEEQYPFFVDMPAAEFASLVADGNELAIEYTRLMRQAETARNKPVLADEDGKPISAETAKAAAQKLAELQPWVVDKANEVYQWWDAFMREWAVGTQLSLTQYENMRAMYPHYVPLHRVMDGVGPGGSAFARDGYIGTGKVTHAIKGSVLPIQELEDQYYSAMQRIIRLNRANELYRSVVEEAMFDNDGTFKEYAIFDWDSAEAALKQDLWDYDSDVDKTGLAETEDRQYKVSAYIDGVKVSAFVNKGMYEGLAFVTGAKGDRLSKITTLGAKLTGPMKTMLTGINPTFAVRNVVRDFPTAVINSISGVAFPKYYARAAMEIAGNSENWQRFKALGGAHANYYNMEGGYAEALAEKPGVVGKTVDFMGTVNNVTEAQTRFAEYLATIDRMPGGDTYENRLLGIKNSAEVTVDFGRVGIYGRLINAWVPYWNPAIQGVDKVFRSVFQQPEISKAVKTVGRAALVTILPEILFYALRKALDREEEWEQLSDYVKDSYYLIPLKDEHKFIRLPKNREWGAILGTSFMRILEGIEGRENPFENYFETSINTNFLPPEILSNAIGVSWALELAKNENFAGSQIVPYQYQDVAKSEQYDADTSMAAYLIAKAGNMLGAELSPMQLDYIMQDYVGDFYGLLLSSFPVGLFTGEVTGEDILGDIKSELSGSWVSDNRYSNDIVTQYYAMVDQIDSEVNTLKLRDPDYDESTIYKLRSAMNTSDGYAKRISNLNKEARLLPDGAEKDAIKEQIISLASEALTFHDRVMSGEIADPTLYVKYAEYGEDTALELIRLDSFGKEYTFEPAEPESKKITDPESRIREYVLTDTQKEAFAAFYNTEYARLAKQTMRSFAYQNGADSEKAEMLEAMNRQARENAASELVEWMEKSGVKPTVKTAYQKYSSDVIDTMVYLDSYQSSEAYNFMPRDDAPTSYVDPDNSKYKYYLNDYYKTQYMELYRIIYEDLFSSVTADPTFYTYTPAQMASRLHDMKEDVGDLAKENIIVLMKRDGFMPELRDTRADY